MAAQRSTSSIVSDLGRIPVTSSPERTDTPGHASRSPDSEAVAVCCRRHESLKTISTHTNCQVFDIRTSARGPSRNSPIGRHNVPITEHDADPSERPPGGVEERSNGAWIVRHRNDPCKPRHEITTVGEQACSDN
jgi:hypothetical protein